MVDNRFHHIIISTTPYAREIDKKFHRKVEMPNSVALSNWQSKTNTS